jgi:mono/diheme cytochrome c family protein
MPPRTLELIVHYLAGRAPPNSAPASSAPGVQRAFVIPDEARAVYARFCAACHGASGEGDGPNAGYLPVQPTAHADSVYMSTRPDDALFDAIYAGGLIMGRSNRMPPFGGTLDRETIEGLVGLMRELCRCRGPSWSRDGQ